MICPILSKSCEEEKCAWYNEVESRCAILAIAGIWEELWVIKKQGENK